MNLAVRWQAIEANGMQLPEGQDFNHKINLKK